MISNNGPGEPSRSKKGVIDKIKMAAGWQPSPTLDTGKGRSKSDRCITHGFSLVKGKANHPMEDFHVAAFRQVHDRELGLFAIFDGHLGHDVAQYLQSHLFDNIMQQPEFWENPSLAMVKAYEITDRKVLQNTPHLGLGGSTAVTAILIDGRRLLTANVGDSRAVLCQDGFALQLSVDHEPTSEKDSIREKGGFVTTLPGDVPRVDGQLAVARAFGDKNLKVHLRADPDIHDMQVDKTDEFLILASDGLWKVMDNKEAVDLIRKVKDPKTAAKKLTEAALERKSKDDISVIVVRFR